MTNILTGVTLIRNGNTLKYPWKECIRSMASYCDQVVVNFDPGDGVDLFDIKILKSELRNVKFIEHKWNMSNTGDGRELANQINLILPKVKTPWTLYLQADEFLLESDGLYIKNTLPYFKASINQIELHRTYFWGDLKTRAPEFEIWLGRIFRSGTHLVGGDGMYIKQLYNSHPPVRYKYNIFHYSRMGNENEVNKRWRNLDLFFHDAEEVAKFPQFTYDSLTKPVINYTGKHPKGIKEFYNG